MDLYLIRHGEMQGDPFCCPARPVAGCLSPRGVAQAQATARALSGIAWHAVLASPYGRALQTAEIVCGAEAPIAICDCLKEWQPSPALREAPSTVWEEMNRRGALQRAEEQWQTEAGEGTYAFFGRVVPGVLDRLAELGCRPGHGGFLVDARLATASVAIVAHGGSLGVLLSHLLGLRPFPVSAFAFQLAGAARLTLSEKAGVWHPQLVIPGPQV